MSLVVSIPLAQLKSCSGDCLAHSSQQLSVIEEFRNKGCLIKMLFDGLQEDPIDPLYRTEQELDELIVRKKVVNSCTSFVKESIKNVEPYKSIGFILSTSDVELLQFWDEWAYTQRFNDFNERVEWNPLLHCYCIYNPHSQKYDIETEYNGLFYQAPNESEDFGVIASASYENLEEFKCYMTNKCSCDFRNEVIVTYSKQSIIGIVIDENNLEYSTDAFASKAQAFKNVVKKKLELELPIFLLNGKLGRLTMVKD
ncbi:hypothetical protein JQC92_20555 [Shewanella sp. 202IG2-18]|uniref:hypothetical protein n=1 Tax=Parashewanella hymeniacidonis TaxID=2807618 RepID=UPI001961D94F|nr:hypothetical protein [Parashewanella hymeniacidonis]MBM7074383.1 hypothetical protein [Parashewanella hymeniacidonis]